MVRALPCEAANVLLTRVQRWSWLKRWGIEVARRRGKMRTQVAVARLLAVIMHRMWIDGTPFRWSRDGGRRGSTGVGKGGATGKKDHGIRSADASGRSQGPRRHRPTFCRCRFTWRSARTLRD